MKCVYCSNCGLRLAITRKALSKYGRIIDLVEPHVCLAEPVEFDLTPVEVPAFVSMPDDLLEKGKNKFVQKLNELNTPHDLRVGPFQGDGYIEGPGDRRDIADVKKESSSTAPRTLLDSIKILDNSTPANDIKDEPREE